MRASEHDTKWLLLCNIQRLSAPDYLITDRIEFSLDFMFMLLCLLCCPTAMTSAIFIIIYCAKLWISCLCALFNLYLVLFWSYSAFPKFCCAICAMQSVTHNPLTTSVVTLTNANELRFSDNAIDFCRWSFLEKRSWSSLLPAATCVWMAQLVWCAVWQQL